MVAPVSVISAISPVHATQRPSTVASLRAELAQYQQKLGDCAYCSSSATLEGKKTIEEVSAQIAGIKHRIEVAEQVEKPVDATATPTTTSATPSATSPTTSATLGSRIDVYV